MASSRDIAVCTWALHMWVAALNVAAVLDRAPSAIAARNELTLTGLDNLALGDTTCWHMYYRAAWRLHKLCEEA